MDEREPTSPEDEREPNAVLPIESQAERFARYHSPEFTRRLTDHLHEAKKLALNDSSVPSSEG